MHWPDLLGPHCCPAGKARASCSIAPAFLPSSPARARARAWLTIRHPLLHRSKHAEHQLSCALALQARQVRQLRRPMSDRDCVHPGHGTECGERAAPSAVALACSDVAGGRSAERAVPGLPQRAVERLRRRPRRGAARAPGLSPPPGRRRRHGGPGAGDSGPATVRPCRNPPSLPRLRPVVPLLANCFPLERRMAIARRPAWCHMAATGFRIR